MNIRIRFIALALGTITCFQAWAGAYPERPIRLVVPFAPGQAADVGARIIAQKLGEALHQSVVVDNKPGVGGNLGAAEVARAAPDGYTLLVGSTATHGINSVLYPKSTFDPIADFAPIAYTGWTPIVLASSTRFTYRTAQALLASGKAKEERYQVAVANPGARIVLQLFNEKAGTHYEPVSYNASGTGFGDVVGGRLPLIIDSLPGSLPMIRSGKIQPLALSSATRAVSAPDIPTLAESGLTGFDLSTWNVYFAPRGTPEGIVAELNAAIVKILADSKTQELLRRAGYEPAPAMSVPEVSAFVTSEYAKWTSLAREYGLQPQ